DSLESRSLVAAVQFTIIPTALKQPAVLSGAAHGIYTSGNAGHDRGRFVQLTGTGTIESLGRVRVTGSVRETAGAAPGQKAGGLTFTNPRGRVTRQLKAPAGDSGPRAAGSFTFVVGGGKGTYQGMTGAGTIVLTRGPSSQRPFPLSLEPPLGPAPTPIP